jgi:NADH dehydrogenase
MALGLVTVFGGSGFLGRYLVQRLAADGARVRVAVRDPEAAAFCKPMGDVGQVVPVQANLRHPASVERAVAGADAVVISVGVLYESGPQSFAAVHVNGPARVAQAAAAAGVRRLLHVSAIGADPESPSKYGRSKAAGEVRVRDAFPGASIVRPSIVFGPEDDFFNRFANMARYAPVLPLLGGGATRFQPVYVGDVAQAMAVMLQDDRWAGETAELGGPRVYSFRQLMQLICEVTGRRRWLVPVPFELMQPFAAVASLLPVPPITMDQLAMLKRDNVAAEGAPGLAELGIEPRTVESVVPTYLARYRRAGRLPEIRFI